MNLSHWNKEDLAQHKLLEELVTKHITWNLNTAEVIQAYRSLVWLSQIKKKIEDSQAELVSVRPAKSDEQVMKKPRKPRQTKPAAGI